MPHEKEREGIVAWDQKGLVVLWPDGHRSRFSWLALRQACQCLECQKQKKESATDADHLVQFYALF
jgi:DUF971 family protein